MTKILIKCSKFLLYPTLSTLFLSLQPPSLSLSLSLSLLTTPSNNGSPSAVSPFIKWPFPRDSTLSMARPDCHPQGCISKASHFTPQNPIVSSFSSFLQIPSYQNMKMLQIFKNFQINSRKIKKISFSLP